MGKGELRWLVKFLKSTPAKLIKPSSFEMRLRLQKAAFLLNYLKVQPFTNYTFSMYVNGPYAPNLAKEYYDLKGVRTSTLRLDAKTRETLEWFSSKDPKWLEVGASILSIKERNENVGKNDIFSVLTLSKPWVTRDYFDSVDADLEQKQLYQ